MRDIPDKQTVLGIPAYPDNRPSANGSPPSKCPISYAICRELEKKVEELSAKVGVR